MDRIPSENPLSTLYEGIDTQILETAPEWFFHEKDILTLKPWVVSYPDENFTSIFIGNSGLRIYYFNQQLPDLEPTWKQHFTPDGYEGISNTDEADLYKFSLVYSAAICELVDFWKNKWPAQIIKRPDIITGHTSRHMFNLIGELLNGVTSESFTRIEHPITQGLYQMNMPKLENGIKRANESGQNLMLTHQNYNVRTRTKYPHIMENCFIPIIKRHCDIKAKN